ncbi:MAG: PTS sugar transporter subunit IIA [Planctomycetaceae bacterium]
MEDFDVAALAAYLHITPDRVLKLATQGRLPGRRMSGGWRFSEAEIHHWLEERIGASDQEALQQVEAALHRSGRDQSSWSIASLCPLERIAVPFAARTRSAAIRDMCQLATEGGLLWDASTMAQAVLAREELHPTALDNGVALLHPRRPQSSVLADSVIALGICPQAIPFASTGHLTDIFFLICSYDDAIHLRILARLSRMISSAAFLENLRQAATPKEAHAAIVAMEDTFAE